MAEAIGWAAPAETEANAARVWATGVAPGSGELGSMAAEFWGSAWFNERAMAALGSANTNGSPRSSVLGKIKAPSRLANDGAKGDKSGPEVDHDMTALAANEADGTTTLEVLPFAEARMEGRGVSANAASAETSLLEGTCAGRSAMIVS
jgi:hypothetical protein